MLCAIARKTIKMTDFSKTGSRNMAETCAINFLTMVSYSTSIATGGLRRLLLPVLMWAGVDLENFRPETAWCSFGVFLHVWSPMEYRSRSVVVLLSTVLFLTIALQQSILPPSRALKLCAIARKSLIITDFSKTGSRNMAETCVFFPFLITHYRTNRKTRETIFGSLVERCALYWYSLKHLLCSIYFADRWRCKCAVRTLPWKHVQVGKFEHSFLPHRTS